MCGTSVKKTWRDGAQEGKATEHETGFALGWRMKGPGRLEDEVSQLTGPTTGVTVRGFDLVQSRPSEPH